MKKLTYLITAISMLFMVSCANQQEKKEVSKIKELHAENLAKSPFKQQLKLSKTERKAHGLPPNKFNEEYWQLTMDPISGRPTPEKVRLLQEQLDAQYENDFANGRVPGDAVDNGWIERGPNNVGGRTRAIMFDPNDTTDNTVFAGGVSGGLWKNTNFSSASSQWVRVDIPENLAVSCLAFDPNNTNVFYAGTGEPYTAGDANGDGLWKSTDGGDTWARVFGGVTGASYFVSSSNITVNSPASIAGNYQSFPTEAFGVPITNPVTGNLILANDPNPPSGATPENGCSEFGPDATGKIALIRRGLCNFDDKVHWAQDNGAIGVIMMNNVPGEPIPMGGDDTQITIPSVMISQADGDALEAALASGAVNVTLNPSTGDFTAMVVPGQQNITDIVIKDNNGTSEVYVSVADSGYSESNAVTTVGGVSYGLYKSTDGTNFTELSLGTTTNGHKYCPNDIDIAADGTIWVATKNSFLFGDGGGTIFSSTDGTTFNQVYTVANGLRTQIACSKQNAGTIYVLAETSTGTSFYKTTSGFVPVFAVSSPALPDDVDPGIDASDIARGQAFFDLQLSVHPTSDNTVYVGGIDSFKTANAGSSWNQLSHWTGSYGKQYMHSDQHIAVFGNNNANIMAFGNDGGVYYSNDGGTNLSERNNGYNTAQFYTVGVAPTTAFNGDYFAGGLQDNGTQLFENANPNGPDSSTQPYGGDGAFTFFDQDGTDRYFIRNYVYNQGVVLYNFDGANVTINSEGDANGAFINPQALDSNLDILYSNYSASGAFIIKRYAGIKSSSTLVKTDLTDATTLTTTPTALTVSPYTTTSSKLLVGTVLGDVILVENADTTPTWTGLDNNVIVGSISDIEFGQSENEMFATTYNYNVNNVWYSGDGGTTWEMKDGDLPDIPVLSILQNPLNTEQVIIGTELGVWFTDNFSSANPTWLQAYNGMSNVRVLDLDMRDDYMVFAATHGRGVFSGLFTPDAFSVEENTISTSLSLFPNPSNGTVNLKTTKNLGNATATIYDINGREVFKQEVHLNGNTTTLNATNLATGMYILKVSNTTFSFTQKLIINK